MMNDSDQKHLAQLRVSVAKNQGPGADRWPNEEMEFLLGQIATLEAQIKAKDHVANQFREADQIRLEGIAKRDSTIETLEARLTEQETELKEWSQQSCGVASKRRLFDTLLAACREPCSLLDKPENEFTETDALAIHLALASGVGPAIKSLDETRILGRPCPHEDRLTLAEAVVEEARWYAPTSEDPSNSTDLERTLATYDAAGPGKKEKP